MAMRRHKALGSTVRNFTSLFHRTDFGWKSKPDHLEDLGEVSLSIVGISTPICHRDFLGKLSTFFMP
jgi:hypothetical protein